MTTPTKNQQAHAASDDLQQRKMFKTWLNSVLEPHGIAPVQNLEDDLADSVKLVDMLAILEAHSHRAPTLGRLKATSNRVRRLDNASFLFQELHRLGVRTTNIGPEDVVDGRSKLLLGLLWRLVSKYSVGGEEGEEGDPAGSARLKMLEWCQLAAATHYTNIAISNFDSDFQDGRAFLVLLDYLRPGAVSPSIISEGTASSRLETAFAAAEKLLHIPPTFDVSDFQSKPDEKSVIIYLAMMRSSADAIKSHERETELERERKSELDKQAEAVQGEMEKLRLEREEMERQRAEMEKAKAELLALQASGGPGGAAAGGGGGGGVVDGIPVAIALEDEHFRRQAASMFCRCSSPSQYSTALDVHGIGDVTGAQLRAYMPGKNNEFAVDDEPMKVAPSPKQEKKESGFKSLMKRVEGMGAHVLETGPLEAAKEMAKKVGAGVDVLVEGGKEKHFHATFKLPPSETYLSSFNCSLVTSEGAGIGVRAVTGRLILSSHYVCFLSDSLSKLNISITAFVEDQIQLCIPFVKLFSPVQAMVGENHSRGMILCTHDHFRFVFFGFYSEDSRALLWEMINERTAHVLFHSRPGAPYSSDAAAVDHPPNKPLPQVPICGVCGLPFSQQK